MLSSRTRTTNRLLWTAQILTAILFLFAGSMKFIMPVEKMQQGPIVFPVAFLYFIGVCECLGGLGLILPGLTRVRTGLTPLAAAGLTIIMIGATVVSIVGMGVAAGLFPAVVGVVTAWIAYGRTRVVPLADVPRGALRGA
ncbi:MAG: DoxX family protein [Gemmatimonadaceae bacterium]|nr:DoxX family protein [Gemmatimonadaceae bacterium]NUP70552.1 DoxX family protein [Gemmatimonadaceae bacterium]